MILRALGGKPENLMTERLKELVALMKPHCAKECCREQLQKWYSDVEEKVGNIPRFSQLRLGDVEGDSVNAGQGNGRGDAASA